MAEQTSAGLIKEGDQVVIRKNKNLKVVPVRKNSKLWIERCKFFLDTAIGFPYGTSFEVVNHKLSKVTNTDIDKDVDIEQEIDDEGVKDNRFLTDTTLNQKLSSDTIRNMRKEGMHGEEIVEQLIQNSATFSQKNEFARQKYIKKKKRKYVPIITVLKPTARLLLEMYYNKGPNRICNLRLDSLAQILSWANVQAGSKLLVVESCIGLVVGAVLERMGGKGTVIQMFSGSAPVQQAVESFDFPEEFRKNLYSFPLNRVAQLKRVSCSSTEDKAETSDATLDIDMTQIIDAKKVDDTATDHTDKTEAKEGQDDESDEDIKAEEQSCESSQQEGNSYHRSFKRRHTEINEEDRKKRWEERQKYYQEVQTLIEKADCDGLIVATKFHPTPIVMNLIDFIAPSRPIAIFCQYKEPLMDCYVHLRDRGGVVLLKLTETWLRGYQVLPDRTHPTVNMSGGGGYLLTGTTVAV